MPLKFPDQTFVFEIFTYANFSTYTLDTSPQTNPMYLVQVDDIPEVEKSSLRSIPVDPDWLLAAWSVDNNGLVANRSASLSLIRGLEALFSYYLSDANGDGPSQSVSDSTISLSPSSVATAIISSYTAMVSSTKVLSGSIAIPGAGSSFGMTPATGSFSNSAFDIRVKREEASPTGVTANSDGDYWLTPTNGFPHL